MRVSRGSPPCCTLLSWRRVEKRQWICAEHCGKTRSENSKWFESRVAHRRDVNWRIVAGFEVKWLWLWCRVDYETAADMWVPTKNKKYGVGKSILAKIRRLWQRLRRRVFVYFSTNALGQAPLGNKKARFLTIVCIFRRVLAERTFSLLLSAIWNSISRTFCV